MSMGRLFVSPVTLARPASTTNRYGEAVPDWSAPPDATWDELGWMTRTGSDEMANGREAHTDTWELSLPATSALDETMRVIHEGATYEVRGTVQRARTPSGPHHVVAQLRRVQG